MTKSRLSVQWTIILTMALGAAAQAGTDKSPRILVEALFTDRAVLSIDGQRRILNAGQRSPEGVRLIAADSKRARLEVAGKVLELGLNDRVGSNYTAPAEGRSVKLIEAVDGQFYVDGTINGGSIRFLVDTGATTIALNSREAERLGLMALVNGQAMSVETASGSASARALRLRNVQAQSIELHDVETVVIDGDFPTIALLGQSFLRRLKMTRAGPLLELNQR